MSEWTPALVEDRLRKGVALKAQLLSPDQTPRVARGIGSIRSSAEDQGDDVVGLATEALSWFRWLDEVDADIVLARLEGAPWKLICWLYGISRPTADRRWRYAHALIAWRLNHPASLLTPSLRSLLMPQQFKAGCETITGGTGRSLPG